MPAVGENRPMCCVNGWLQIYSHFVFHVLSFMLHSLGFLNKEHETLNLKQKTVPLHFHY